MALGDQDDFVGRLKAVLPNGWFQGVTPLLDAVLNGAAAALAPVYDLIVCLKAQTRLKTVSDGFLDLAAFDFFGTLLPRKRAEIDSFYRERLLASLLREKATRKGLNDNIEALTGIAPVIFEPWNLVDAGAYDMGTLAYDAAGGYGELDLPYQGFVTVYRPTGQGVPYLSGYDEGPSGYDVSGTFAYIDETAIPGVTDDDDLYAAVSAVIPAGTVAWVQITSPSTGTFLLEDGSGGIELEDGSGLLALE
jgi:hypothetical protein